MNFFKVLARMGYARGKTKLDKKTRQLIVDETKLAKKIIQGKLTISFSKITARKSPDRIFLEPGFVLKSKDLFKLFKGCSLVYGFAVTIGPALEARRDRYLSEKQSAKAVILDAIGSVAAEELAETTNIRIKKSVLKKGLGVTRRFSPGYGDWGLENQKEFLKWLGAEKIGIKLSPSFQMSPEKSITAVLGATK
jgi:hypothetical protein